MAALMHFNDTDSVLSEELEVLESIYIHELTVQRQDSGQLSIRLNLHPSTGDDLEKQYVCMTLILNPTSKYPDEAPEIEIRNPRGISEDEIQRVLDSMYQLAEERQGGPMLYELTEIAKECLTESNIPHVPCAICLENFTEGDLFMKTNCYHYFHHYCLARYVNYLTNNQEEEDDTTPPGVHNEEEKEEGVVCPICRLSISYDLDLLEQANEPIAKDWMYTVTKESEQHFSNMAEIYARQKANGGIIDLEAEKNKYLVPKDLIISVTTTADSSADETVSDQKPVKTNSHDRRHERRPRQERPSSRNSDHGRHYHPQRRDYHQSRNSDFPQSTRIDSRQSRNSDNHPSRRSDQLARNTDGSHSKNKEYSHARNNEYSHSRIDDYPQYRNANSQFKRSDNTESRRNYSSHSRRNDSPQSRKSDTSQSKRSDNPQSRRSDRPQSKRNDSPQSRRSDIPQSKRNDSLQSRRNDTSHSKRCDSPQSRRSDSPQSKRSDSPQSRRSYSPQSKRNDRPQSKRSDSPESRRSDSPQSKRNDSLQSRRNDTSHFKRSDSPQSRRSDSHQFKKSHNPQSRNDFPQSKKSDNPKYRRNDGDQCRNNDNPQSTLHSENRRYCHSNSRSVRESRSGRHEHDQHHGSDSDWKEGSEIVISELVPIARPTKVTSDRREMSHVQNGYQSSTTDTHQPVIKKTSHGDKSTNGHKTVKSDRDGQRKKDDRDLRVNKTNNSDNFTDSDVNKTVQLDRDGQRTKASESLSKPRGTYKPRFTSQFTNRNRTDRRPTDGSQSRSTNSNADDHPRGEGYSGREEGYHAQNHSRRENYHSDSDHSKNTHGYGRVYSDDKRPGRGRGRQQNGWSANQSVAPRSYQRDSHTSNKSSSGHSSKEGIQRDSTKTICNGTMGKQNTDPLSSGPPPGFEKQENTRQKLEPPPGFETAS